MTAPLLRLENLVKRYGPVTAIAGVSLDISAGEIVCLLGPSGCGKTTLLRLVAGLESPDNGRVLFDGRPLDGVQPHRRGFGMMFQDFALFPHKDVHANVAYGLEIAGWPPAEIHAEVLRMLRLVDLAGTGERTIEQLSGGEQQRVALARTLAVRPRLLLLDEPLGSLDRALRERLMLDLRRILKEVGVTTISVTHDQTEAFAIADRIVVMNAGRIEQVERPEALYEHPRTPFVARFLGYQNLIPGRVAAGGDVETPLGRLGGRVNDLSPGQKVTVLIRPDALRHNAGPGTLGVSGRLVSCAFRGRYYQIWLEIKGQALMFETADPPQLAAGQIGTWQLDLGETLVFDEEE